jgi:poly(3-hydroxybutyrate) depolymerase
MRASGPPLRMSPALACRRSAALGAGGPVLVLRLTGLPDALPATRVVLFVRRTLPALAAAGTPGAGVRTMPFEAERTRNGLDVSASEGFGARWRAASVDGLGGDAEIEFTGNDGVSGVFASERPRRCVGVFGFSAIGDGGGGGGDVDG